jgi:hypothetical protein
LLFAISHVLEPVSYFLSGVFLVYHARKDKRVGIKVLSFCYFLSGLLMIKAAMAFTNNIIIYDLICLLTSIGIGCYFYTILVGRFKRGVVIFICFLNVGYYVVNNWIYPNHLFDSKAYVLLSSSIVVMAFMFMHQILTHLTEEALSMNFDFWFVCSQLVYFLGAFAIFLTYNYLTQKILPEGFYSKENRLLLTNLWSVHNILLFLSSIITSSGIVWIAYRRKSPSL